MITQIANLLLNHGYLLGAVMFAIGSAFLSVGLFYVLVLKHRADDGFEPLSDVPPPPPRSSPFLRTQVASAVAPAGLHDSSGCLTCKKWGLQYGVVTTSQDDLY